MAKKKVHRAGPASAGPVPGEGVQQLPSSRRVTYWCATLAFVMPLGVYLLTHCPSVSLVDSGELLLAVHDFGVAHPPGFPFYVLAAHLFTKVPWISPARAVNLFSAVAAGMALAVLFWAVRHWIMAIARGDRRATLKQGKQGLMLPSMVSDVSALVATLCLGFSFIVWGFSTLAEVYSLNLACLVVSLWALLAWDNQEDKNQRRYIVIAAGFLGLGLSVHNATIMLTLPGFLALVLTAPITRSARLKVTLIAAGVIIPVVVIFYGTIYWRATIPPIFNWGSATDFQRWVWHFTGRQYQSFLFSSSMAAFWATAQRELLRILSHLVWQWTPLGFVVAAGGLVKLWRVKRLFLVALLLIGCNVAYSLSYEINEDKEAYYITTFLVATLCLGYGLAELLKKVAIWSKQQLAKAMVLCCCLPLVILIAHWSECDRSDDDRAQKLWADLSAELEQGALLLTTEWQLYAPWLYLHHVEGFREDLQIIDINLMRRSWYLEYLRQEYPDLMAAVKNEDDRFTEQLLKFEYKHPYEPSVIQARFVELLNALVTTGIRRGASHITVPNEPELAKDLIWAPWGLTFKVFLTEESLAEPPPIRQPTISQWLYGKDDLGGKKVRWLYGTMLNHRARWHTLKGEHALARKAEQYSRMVGNPSVQYPHH